MMMRDNVRTREYFDIHINENWEDINYYKSKLDNNEVKEERVEIIKREVQRTKLYTIIAMYSRGDEVSEIKKEFDEMLELYLEIDNETQFSYSSNLEVISLAVLLDIEEAKLLKIHEIISEKDSLFEFLLTKKLEIQKSLFVKYEWWQKLMGLILLEDQEAQIEGLKTYINTWYEANEKDGNFESIKNTKVNTYSGYWCFEAGAVAKILGLDDSDLKSQQYYPFDMVQFKG